MNVGVLRREILDSYRLLWLLATLRGPIYPPLLSLMVARGPALGRRYFIASIFYLPFWDGERRTRPARCPCLRRIFTPEMARGVAWEDSRR
ncbi:hypothetical protein Trydic_g6317 [Trypoxylus dichotomus]